MTVVAAAGRDARASLPPAGGDAALPPVRGLAPADLRRLRAVAAVLPRCTFPPPGTPLTCAVSGGPDSLALLVVAVAAGCRVTAVHVDHGLRAGSAAEGDVVAAAASRLGAGFRRERVTVVPGPNLEARARAARYAVLPPDVATGHTMDDQAETVLVQVLRGSGLDGLTGMAPGPEHPLLGVRRAEARAVCEAAGLDWVEDPSNLDPAHLRNRVRHELLPLCDAVAGRDPVPVLARLAALCRDDAAYLDTLATEALPDPTDGRALAAAPLPLARRAVRRWLRQAGATATSGGRRSAGTGPATPGPAAASGPAATPGADHHPPTAAEVARVLAVARGDVLGTELAGGWRVRRTARRLRLEAPSHRRGPGSEAR